MRAWSLRRGSGNGRRHPASSLTCTARRKPSDTARSPRNPGPPGSPMRPGGCPRSTAACSSRRGRTRRSTGRSPCSPRSPRSACRARRRDLRARTWCIRSSRRSRDTGRGRGCHFQLPWWRRAPCRSPTRWAGTGYSQTRARRTGSVWPNACEDRGPSTSRTGPGPRPTTRSALVPWADRPRHISRRRAPIRVRPHCGQALASRGSAQNRWHIPLSVRPPALPRRSPSWLSASPDAARS
jgi:hypothetical protein